MIPAAWVSSQPNPFRPLRCKHKRIMSNRAAASMTNATRCVPRKAGYKRWASCLTPDPPDLDAWMVYTPLNLIYIGMLGCSYPLYIYIHKKSKLIVGESLEDSEDTCFFFPLLAICVRFIFPKYTVDTGILTFCLHDSHGILSVSLVFARALERWPPQSLTRNISTNFSRNAVSLNHGPNGLSLVKTFPISVAFGANLSVDFSCRSVCPLLYHDCFRGGATSFHTYTQVTFRMSSWTASMNLYNNNYRSSAWNPC